MGHLFPSKEVLSCYFQRKPLWQRSSIPRRCWNLASCWCSSGVLGLWKHAPGILQTIHMHGDALLLQLLSELTGLPLHFQKYLSIVHCRSCCTFATLNCTFICWQWAQSPALTLLWNPRSWNTNLSSFWNNIVHFWEIWYWICWFLALTWMFLYSLHQVSMSLVGPLGNGDRESRTCSGGSFYI